MVVLCNPPRIPGAPLIPHILSRASFCEADAAHFTRQLCAALAYMHGRGLLHLDVRVSGRG